MRHRGELAGTLDSANARGFLKFLNSPPIIRTTCSRPYDISKTLEEFVLGKGKTRAYRSVKLLFLSPPALGGVLPFPIAGCG